MSEEAFIYEAIRTPRGKQRNGSLNEVKPLNLVVGLVDELRRRYPDLDENLISDMILGVVSPVGDQGGDIARTAVLAAGLPETTGVCSSTGSAPPVWRPSTPPLRRFVPAGTTWCWPAASSR